MVIDITSPEFSTVLYNELKWLEDYAKNFELSRRKVLASASRSEKDRKEIENLSEAFSYVLNVEGGRVEIERIPPEEKNQTANDIIQEAFRIFDSCIGNEVQYTLSNSSALKDLISNQLEPQILQLFGGGAQ